MLYAIDCDGVLIDSEIIASEIDSEMLKEEGFEITPAEIHHRFAGLTIFEIKAVVEAELGRPLRDDFVDRHREEMNKRLAEEVDPVEGVHEMLDMLADTPRCVCSNSSPERLQLTLTKTQLYSRFEPNIFSAVAVGTKRPKPDPNVYSYAATHFGIDPAQVVALDDSAFGVTAAKQAGLRVVGFTGASHTWHGHADALTDAGADTCIHRLTDFPATAAALLAWRKDVS